MLFNNIKDKIMRGEINLLSDNINVLLLTGSPVDVDAVSLADIPASNRVGIQQLDNVAFSNPIGTNDLWVTADDAVFPTLGGLPISQVILYIDSIGNNESLDYLLWARNANYVPDGTDLSVSWGQYVFNMAGNLTGDDWYYKGKEKLLTGQLNLMENDIIRVVLTRYGILPSDFLPEIVTDEFLSDLPTVIGTAMEVKGRTLDDGVLNGDDVVYPNLTGGEVDGIALVKYNTVTPSMSELIYLFREGMNLPLTPDDSTTAVVWNNNPAQMLCLS